MSSAAYFKEYRQRNRIRDQEKRRVALVAWRKRNPEKVKAQSKRARFKRGDNLRKRSLAWYHANKVRAAKNMRAWRLKNRPHINARHSARMQSDISWRIRRRLSSRIWEVLKIYKGVKKASATLKLLGCSRQELLVHLETQFKPGMCWENYGYSGWHVDHIKPCAAFDLSKIAQQRECFHYTNLQPLWWRDNIIKGAKY